MPGYELGRENGALAGKLIGAGGGGFLMFYTEQKARLRRAMFDAGDCPRFASSLISKGPGWCVSDCVGRDSRCDSGRWAGYAHVSGDKYTAQSHVARCGKAVFAAPD
jgi:hypothetical protein